MGEQKKLFIRTYGCQMNVYDSERMAEALAPQGYVTTDTPEAADLILLNTCHIREKAAEKVYSELGRLRPLKALNPDLRIGVAGCVAQAEGEEIMEEIERKKQEEADRLAKQKGDDPEADPEEDPQADPKAKKADPKAKKPPVKEDE